LRSVFAEIGVMLPVNAWREYRHCQAARKSVGSTAPAQQSDGTLGAEMLGRTGARPR
jgi:hypothetical protein